MYYVADVFENFVICLKIDKLDPTHFTFAPGLAWQAALKKDKSKIRIIDWCSYVINGRKSK